MDQELQEELDIEVKRLLQQRHTDMEMMKKEHEENKAKSLHELQMRALEGLTITRGDGGETEGDGDDNDDDDEDLQELRRSIEVDCREHRKVESLLERMAILRVETYRMRKANRHKQCKSCAALLAYNAELLTKSKTNSIIR